MIKMSQTHIAPHEYQNKAVKFGLQHKTVYYAIDTGLGKTRIILMLAQKLKCPFLVLGPLGAICNTWPDEIEKWAPELTYTVLHGPYKDILIEERNKDIYLLNYDGLKWFYNYLRKPSSYWDSTAVCYDEASFVKSHSTQRFKMLKRLSCLHTEYRFALSATPSPEGYHNLWSQYHLVNDKTFESSFTAFRNRYFNYIGPPVYKTTLIPKKAEEIENKIRPITFRLKAEDWLNMPELIYNKILLTLPNKLYKQYQSLEREFYIKLQEQEIVLNSTVALTLKLRQFIQGALYTEEGYPSYIKLHTLKIDMLKELITSHPNNNILCLIQFKFEVDMIRKAFGNDIPIIAGETKASTTQQYIKNWNKGNMPLLVCHPASVSHGLNLQSGGSMMAWVGLSYSMQQYYQTIRRLYRQGQKSKSVIVHHIMLKNTLDIEIYRAVKAKEKRQDILLSKLKTYFSNKYKV